MLIGNRFIDRNASACYIIAEIGINHNGSVDVAKELMIAAAEAGADAVKFQMRRNLEESVPKHMWEKRKETLWGEMSYMEYKKKLEFPNEVYEEVFYPLAELLDIDLGISVWDSIAVQQVDILKVFDFIKVPSAHMANETIMHLAATRGLPFFWSTGMHNMVEIQAAYDWLHDWGVDNWGVFHCNSSYPAANEDLNLRVIRTFQQGLFLGKPVGYSGHETGLATTVAAVALGAKMVERHITLDRSMWGTDQSSSVELGGFERLVKDIRAVESALGDGVKRVSPAEQEMRRKLSLT